jgi:hypothetical protein
LQDHNWRQKQKIDGVIVGKRPQSDDPGGVEYHDERKVRAPVFNAASRKQAAFVLPRPPQFDNALEREKSKKRRTPVEMDHSSTATK